MGKKKRKVVKLVVERFDMGSGAAHYHVRFIVEGRRRPDYTNDVCKCNTPEEADAFIKRRIEEKYNDTDYELVVEDHTDHVYGYEGD
jgi:hypothetical protein